MSRTDVYRAQHQKIVAALGELTPLLKEASLQKHADLALTALRKLTSTIHVHLSMEDQRLYPELANSPNAELTAKAKEFMTEMAGIASAYDKYANHWTSPDVIKANAGVFITETKKITSVLNERIRKEERDFYPLADRFA